MATYRVEILLGAEARGEALWLEEPLSLWGGLDPGTGAIVDPRHPQQGQCVTGRILVLPGGRGSSSASSVLLEAVRLQTAPAGIITPSVDGILALGAVVAQELYGRSPLLACLEAPAYQDLSAALQTGSRWLSISQNGLLQLE